MKRYDQKLRAPLLIWGCVIGGIAVACYSFDAPSSPESPGTAKASTAGGSTGSTRTAAQDRKLGDPRTLTEGLGQRHNRHLHALKERRAELKQASDEKRCRILFETTLATALEARAEIGANATSDAELRRGVAAMVGKVSQCKSVPPFSLFGTPANSEPPAAFLAPQADESEWVSEAALPFSRSIADAALKTNGQPTSFAAAGNDAYNAGWNLPVADRNLGAVTLNVAVYSNDYWYAQYNKPASGDEQWSVFSRGMQWQAYAAVDLFGCLAGTAYGYAQGKRGWRDLGLACYYGAASASGGRMIWWAILL